MIRIDDKSRCTGCTACMNICPAGCITMREDREGFLYPAVDEAACIGCDACVDVCPFNNRPEKSKPEAYAVRSPFESASSSGGAVAAVAAQWIEEGGCVCGAAFDESLHVCHVRAGTLSELSRLQTSKYVQSRLGDSFSDIKALLGEGQRVMFVGTPCQVAGLQSFIGRNPSLLTIQVACHGVPPPRLWKVYLEAMERRMGDKIHSVNFRDKSNGWKQYNVAYKLCSKEVKVPFGRDTYMLAYLQNLSLRPSCYECRFRGMTYGDLTAGDLWNAGKLLPEHSDGKGFTLLAVNTEGGRKVIDTLLREGKLSCCIPIPYSDAADSNSGFGGTLSCPERRSEFFSGLYSAGDVMKYMNAFARPVPKMKAYYAKIHSVLSRIKKKLMR